MKLSVRSRVLAGVRLFVCALCKSIWSLQCEGSTAVLYL